MKSLTVKASGTVTPGDLIMLRYIAPQGGCSSARYRVPSMVDLQRRAYEAAIQKAEETGQPFETPVVKIPTIEDVITALANEINSVKGEWCPGSGDFKATAKGTTLYVMCSNFVDNVRFEAEVEGAQTEKFELSTFGGRGRVAPPAPAPTPGVSVPGVPQNVDMPATVNPHPADLKTGLFTEIKV